MKHSKKWGWIAVVLICCLLNGCSKNSDHKGEEKVEKEEIIQLKAITIGNEPKEGLDELYEQLDALTIPELNCTLRLEFIPWGEEKKQINIAVNSGDYDFIPGGVFSDYRLLASRNAFLDLNQYLDLVPNLVEHYEENNKNLLKNTEINGCLYGIPQLGNAGLYMNVSEGFFYREDLRKEWGLEPVTDLESMEAYLYRAKEDERYANEPLITDNRIWTSLWYMLAGDKYLEISSILENPFFVVSVDNPYEPILRMETPEFKEVLQYLKKWYDDGIIANNLLVSSDNEGSLGLKLMSEDKKPCETNVPIWSCNTNYVTELTEKHENWEYRFFSYLLDKPTMYLSSGGGSVISISSKSTHPETAIKLLEKLHTDIHYYSLLVYGVEGTQYVEDNGIINYEGIAEDNRFSGWTAAGDDFMNITTESSNKDWKENVFEAFKNKVQQLVETVSVCPIDTFSFSTSEVDDILRAMSKVKETYYQPMLCGECTDIDAELQEANQKLQEAGASTYLAKIEKELQEYKKNKEKLQ